MSYRSPSQQLIESNHCLRDANDQVIEANRALVDANTGLREAMELVVSENIQLHAENARMDQVVRDAAVRYNVLAQQIEAEVEKKFDELVTKYLANEAVIRDLRAKNQELEARVAALGDA